MENPNEFPESPEAEPQSAGGLAVAAMVCGILGFCVFPAALAALIMGIIALSKAKPNQPKGMAIAGVVMGGLGVTLIPIALLLGILVPVLGAAKKNANILKESVNQRNIAMAANVYGTSNKDWLPGLTSRGLYEGKDFEGKYYFGKNTVTDVDSGAGATTDSLNNYAMAVLLDDASTTPMQWLSPGETGANTGGAALSLTAAAPDAAGRAGPGRGEVTRLNFSYALLQYGTDSLKREWKANQNQQAVVLGTRLIFSEGEGTSAPNKFNTVWTEAQSGRYKGSIVRGDISTSTENFTSADPSSTFGTLKYGSTTFTPSANGTSAVGAFGKTGADLRNFGAAADKGQLGSVND